jgi:hypothetical protein
LKPLRIPYKVFPDGFGGQAYSAMLNVQIALPDPKAPRTKRFEVVIDSGASRCHFHADFARHLGIDLTQCPTEPTLGISGSEETRLHDLTLYIPGGPVVIRAGFKENLPLAGLLGMNGFFQHFRVTFDPAGRCCELERLYQA